MSMSIAVFRRSGELLALAAILSALLGCSGQSPPETSSAEREKVEAESRQRSLSGLIKDAEGREKPLPVVEPPEGTELLVDEEGQEYWVMEVPKVEGHYIWLDEDTIRVRHGLRFTVLDHDDDTFFVKILTTKPRSAPKERAEEPKVDPEAVAAAYRTDVEAEDVVSLEPFGSGLPASGRWRNGFDVADMNGDGHLDIVHGSPRTAASRPRIFLGDGAGNFQLWRETTFPTLTYAYGDAAAGDLDGDGHQDIVLGMHGRGLVAMVGDGVGGFTLWNRGLDLATPGQSNRVAFSTKAIELVDWDADGLLDILALSEGPRSFDQVGQPVAYGKLIYRNRGDGSWERIAKPPEGTLKIFGDHVAVGDFDGDGLVDFATSSSVMNERRLVNMHREDHSWKAVEVAGLRRRAYVFAVAVADFDADGLSDLVVGHSSRELGVTRTGIDLLLARSTPDSWERRVLYSTDQRMSFTALATGELNGDGSPDVVAADWDGRLWVFLSDGEGSFVRDLDPGAVIEDGCRGYGLRLVDLDGDGLDEVLAGFSDDGCRGAGRLTAYKAELR